SLTVYKVCCNDTKYTVRREIGRVRVYGKHVQIGRVVLLNDCEDRGKICAIVEIIDANRRAKLTDYDRFKLMKAKQMRNRLINVEYVKLRKAHNKTPPKPKNAKKAKKSASK
uniref:60S ribosomal protein L14 n=1 Tax=Romanomermis culicivorax TaxID=13658 RepID=A0A915HFP0_ROMCU